MACSSRSPRSAHARTAPRARSTTSTSKLLNLMQGRFPIEPRPYAAVAEEAGHRPRTRCSRACRRCSTTGSSARSRRSSTRARSATARCSSPPRSTPSTRGAPRRSSTRTPASATTTCATTTSTCGSRSPSRRTRSSACRARSTSSQSEPAPSRSASCRRSSSSRSAWTSRWRATRRRSPQGRRGGRARAGRAKAALRRASTRAVIRATQGDLPVVARAVRARRAPSSASPVEQLLEHLEGMKERGLLRRVAAILFHRRAGFSANGMGVWKVPDGPDRRDRPADGRLPRHLHCYQRPTYEDWPYQSSRWPTAAPRRSATRSSTRSRDEIGHQRARDALLVDGVQEDPAPVLHRRLQELGARARRRLT